MSSRSSHMIRKGVKLKWIKRDTYSKRKAKRKTAKVSRRKNRG